MPAYHEYPRSGEIDPNPLRTVLRVSVTRMRERYLTLLYPSCRGTRRRRGAPCGDGSSWPFMRYASRVCGCQASAMSRLSQAGSKGKKTTYCAFAWIPTRFNTEESGTPVYSTITDQPSSQACCVICVREGICFKS